MRGLHQATCAFVSGDLSPVSRAAIDQHLSHCPTADGNLNQLEKTVLLLKKRDGHDRSSDFSTRLHASSARTGATHSAFHQAVVETGIAGLDSGPRLEPARWPSPCWFCCSSERCGAVVLAEQLSLSPPETVAASFRIPAIASRSQLDFVADASVDDVEFEITLPGELEFIDGDRQFRTALVVAWFFAIGSEPSSRRGSWCQVWPLPASPRRPKAAMSRSVTKSC